MADKQEVNEIEYSGHKIILPEEMTMPTAVDVLTKRIAYEQQEVEVVESVRGFVWDGALAFYKAMIEMFGWTEATATKRQGMFGGTSSKPPRMIKVEIDVGETVAIPWGSFKVANIDGTLETGITEDESGRDCLSIRAVIKRKHERLFNELVVLTRKILAEQSIYKGKVVRLQFDDDSRIKPSFIDVSNVKEKEIIFSKIVQDSIDTSLYTPIEKADVCREHQIPLKRGILLSGKYGTGKTLVANLTAKKCKDNKWTFIMIEEANMLAKAVEFARAYQPAVVFCEDIDRALEGDRDSAMDNILNVIDGVGSKGTEIMIILTTNNIENIHQAMLRPGRLDAIINVLPPDVNAVVKLVKMYGRGLIAEHEDLTQVGVLLNGKIPAVIRECVERAKLSAIKFGCEGIDSAALVDSATSMKLQLDLLESSKMTDEPNEMKLGLALKAVVEDTLGRKVKDVYDLVDDVHDHVS